MSIISQFLKSNPGRHLAVQWFGLCDFTVVAQFQSMVWELKSLTWRGKKKKRNLEPFTLRLKEELEVWSHKN